MLGKEESATQLFVAQYEDMINRLDEMSLNRNIGEPTTVSDSKARNFSWNDGGGGTDSGGWGGNG